MTNLLQLLLTIILMGSTTCLASSITFSGFITSNQTWSVDTVNIIGNVNINNGVTLNVSPGCKILMTGFYKWTINGNIKAIGTQNSPIYFTSTDTLNFWDLSFGNAGWKGMYFEVVNTNDSTLFEHCIFSYVKRGSDANNPISAIQASYVDKIRISHCLFTHNFNSLGCPAILLLNSSINILNSTFSNNSGDIGGCISLMLGSAPLIHGNTFVNNFARRNGGAITSQSSFPIITNNGFYNNSIQLANCGPSDGGGALRCTNGTIAYVANNVFANNSAGSKGGAIECLYGSHSIIENNTIVCNNGYSGGGGLYLFESSPLLRNNIFWGNTRFNANFSNQIQFFTDDSEPVIEHCVFQGGTADFMFASGVTYAGSVNSLYTYDPLFISSSGGSGIGFNGMNADWRLQQTSPCIDAGSNNTQANIPSHDYWGGQRFSGSTIDLGAYEHYKGVFTQLDELAQDFLVYPNPSTGIINVISDQSNSVLDVYSVDGKCVLSTLDKVLRLNSGIYFIHLQGKVKKVVID